MGQVWNLVLVFGCRREAAAKHHNLISLSNSFRPDLPCRRNHGILILPMLPQACPMCKPRARPVSRKTNNRRTSAWKIQRQFECHGFGDGPSLTGSYWEARLGFGVWLPPPGGSHTPTPIFTPKQQPTRLAPSSGLYF